MHLDENFLICTLNSDGKLDKNDQLQRTAMCYLVNNYVGDYCMSLEGIRTFFQESPGVYRRYPGGRTGDLSGDALLSILAAFVRRTRFEDATEITKRIIDRGGFSQNIYDMYGRTEKKTPDFILLRALPLMWRCSEWAVAIRYILFSIVIVLSMFTSAWFLFLLIFVTDIPLVLMALATVMPVWEDDGWFRSRSPDDVDDNVPIMTFIACSSTFPTILSTLSPYLFAKLRQSNYGCELRVKSGDGVAVIKDAYGPVLGALRWYHRAPAGNPEIVELYRPEIKKYFGEDNPHIQL